MKLIVSIFMDNIQKETVELQKAVVNKRNPSNYDHIHVQTKMSHADTIDFILRNDQLDTHWDLIMFLDIDAIPLRRESFDIIFGLASCGDLVGDAQSSNHINEGKHIFVAPSVVAFSKKTYNDLGKPSANPTSRGDVMEEFTWKAEEKDIPIIFFTPISYDLPVVRMPWETDKSPAWKLPNGLPEYGVGTKFGYEGSPGYYEPLFYHNFQIFHGNHQEYFHKVCREELAKQE